MADRRQDEEIPVRRGSTGIPARGSTSDSGFASERDGTGRREGVCEWALDEAGDLPATDSDVEAGMSRRAERYED